MFKLSSSLSLIIGIIFGSVYIKAFAEEYTFDPVFVHGSKDIDIKRFASAKGVPAGTYLVDMHVNGLRIGKQQVVFQNSNADIVEPCFMISELQSLNIDWIALKKLDSGLIVSGCQTISHIVEGASALFDSGEQKLDISIPQKFVLQDPRGFVPKEFWDSGVNGGFLNYFGNTFFSNGNSSQKSQFLNLNSGINLGDWHFRNSSTVVKSLALPLKLSTVSSYVERDISDWAAKLIIGDSFTDGRLFDSFGIRGVTLASDELMEPSSLRGYAPVIRGTSRTNAKITVSQNGFTVYETTVSPGPFEIRDLYPTGTGGDYLVTVTEADGQQVTSIVPFAAIPLLLRKGSLHFSLSLGILRDPVINLHPAVFSALYQYGVSSNVSLYGGAQASSGYAAVMGGSALNTRLGALGLDLALAVSNVSGAPSKKGIAVRSTYSKGFEDLGANIFVGAYRYASSGYLTLEQSVASRELREFNFLSSGDVSLLQRKNQLQVVFNQNLPHQSGSVFISGSSQNYWNHSSATSQLQIGYSNYWKKIRYNVSISNGKSFNSTQSAETQVMLGVTIPLDHGITSVGSNAFFSRGSVVAQQSVSSSLGDSNQFSYGLNATEGSQRSMLEANSQYHGTSGTVSASASHGPGYSQGSVGLAGSLIAYRGGVILSGPVGDTFGIVEADGGDGASISSSPGLKVNKNGRAVIPFLSPYSFNKVLINTEGMQEDTEFTSTEERVAPHTGSIALLKFKRIEGQLMFLRAVDVRGSVMPFGAEVFDINGLSIATVGHGGKILFRSKSATGILKINQGSRGNCNIAYTVPVRTAKSEKGFLFTKETCFDTPA